MNEAGVLGRFVRAFGRIVAMMQFNMYHHYTVDEHLLRCIGILADIERGGNDEFAARQRADADDPAASTARCSMSRCSCTTSPRAASRTIRSPAPRIARRFCPRLGLSPADTDTVAWLIEQHLVMSTIAQSRDLSDRKTIENFAAVVQSLERMKLLPILTTADIRAVGPGVWNGWKAQLLRTLYYETEPVLTGGFSEVNRAQRVAMAQAEFRAELKDWPAGADSTPTSRGTIRPTGSRSICRTRSRTRISCTRPRRPTRRSRPPFGFDAARGVTELTVLAPDHPLAVVDDRRRLRGGRRQYRRRADLHHHRRARARHHRGVARVRAATRTRRAAPRASPIRSRRRCAATLKLPDVMARRSAAKGRLKAFAVEPEVTINNQWSNRYTVVEVTGLDRPGLLYELTATLSKLSLNIASAHVATFGERVVDVFYVTDLLGAKITSPTRAGGDQARAAALFAASRAARRIAEHTRR